MKFSPKVSIIMNCHNGEKYLRESIHSVLNQTYKNWELIFFDNSSSDNSKKIFFDFKDKRLKYFSSKVKLNLYNARDLAIKQASGKFISFLDTDDLWLKNKLETQIKLIKKKKSKFIYTNYFTLRNNKKKLYSNKKLPEGFITQKLLNFYFIPILTVIFEKKIMEEMKAKFDKDFNIIGDFDFFLKLSKWVKFHYIHKPLAIYRIHNTNYSRIYNKDYSIEMKNWLKKNKKYFKNYNLKAFEVDTIYTEIKSLIYNKNYFIAVKRFLKFPNKLTKLKLLILFFLPKRFFVF